MITFATAASVSPMASRKSAGRGKPRAAQRKRSAKPSKRRPPKKLAPRKAARSAPAKAKRASPKKKGSASGKRLAPKGPAQQTLPFDLPELPEIEGYVRSLPPPIVPIVNRLRQLVRAAAPEARELLDPNGPAYEVNGLFARIEPGEREVLMTFLRGAALDAPEGTLSGDGETRVVSIGSLAQLKESVLQGLVRQAVLLNVKAR